MTDENIRSIAYDFYLKYVSYCDSMGAGLACGDYMTLRDEILNNHTRKISYNRQKGLYCTYVDNKTMLTCKTLEGLQDKIFIAYMERGTGLFSFSAVLERAFLFNLEHDFLSRSTVERYRVDYNKYLKDSTVFLQDIRSITASEINGFFVEFMQHKPTSKVAANVKTVIRLAFNYARIQEGVECLQVNTLFSNMQFSKRAFAPKKKPVDRVFSDDYRAELLKHLSSSSLDLGIKLCFYTGLRVGELCALQVNDIDFDNKVLHVYRSEVVEGKGDSRRYYDSDPKCYKYRDVILSDAALAVLDELCSRSDFYLFPFRDFHYHKCSFDSRLRVLCKKYGLPAYSMHDIRRTYASRMLDQEGVTCKFVQEQLGHTDIRTTENYYHYTTKHKNEYLRMANLC